MSLLDERGTGAISWQRNLAVLWCGVFFACASYTMVVPFLPVYLLQELHVESSEVNFWSGLVYSVTFLGASIMAPYWGARADRVGQRRMAIRAGFGLAFTYWLAGISQSPEQLLGVRILTGLISGFVPASMSLVSSTLPESRMGWGMGLMQTAVASGSILGPMMGGYFSSWYETIFFCCQLLFRIGDSNGCAFCSRCAAQPGRTENKNQFVAGSAGVFA